MSEWLFSAGLQFTTQFLTSTGKFDQKQSTIIHLWVQLVRIWFCFIRFALAEWENAQNVHYQPASTVLTAL